MPLITSDARNDSTYDQRNAFTPIVIKRFTNPLDVGNLGPGRNGVITIQPGMASHNGYFGDGPGPAIPAA